MKGEFNLFDNYVERVGMSKEDADRLRNIFRPNKEELKKTTAYREFLKNPLTKSEEKLIFKKKGSFFCEK